MNLPLGILAAPEYARSEKLINLFVSLIVPSDVTDCWRWVGNLNVSRHKLLPLITVGGRQYSAYRVLYYFSTGLWPKYLRRTCKNRLCVNISHIEEYERDTLTHGQVKKMRFEWDAGVPIKVLAEKYNVSKTTVSDAIHKYTYKKVA